MKRLFLGAVFVLITLTIFGQNKSKVDAINATKVAFFTDKLDLTAAEAQKFWPVYNDYRRRKNKIIQDKKNLMKYCSENMANLSNEEMAEIADKYTEYFKKEADLFVKFNDKFKSVIPVEKVMKLYIADNQFKIYLLNEIKKTGK